MPTSADVAWVDVLPSMKNFLPQLRRQANSAAGQAGGSAGRSFGEAFGDSAKASVEAAQSKLVAAQKKAADATGALTVAQARLEDIRKRSSVSAGILAAAEERVAKAQRTVELQTSGVARAENNLAVASAYATREANGLTTSLQKQSIISKAFSGTVGALGTIVQRAWLPVSAALGAAGAIGVRTAAQLEQSRVAFTNMLGSAEAADKFLRRLADFAAKTPFEFSDVTKASQRLMAMGIEANDVIPYLTAIGDAVSAMGGGAAQVDQVTTAIGQMSAKGRIQSDELLQLTEAGIPALKILASQYGVTTGEMQDMITKGNVLSADALPLLIEGMENGTEATQAFGGMMAEQSKSLTGLWSTFKDTVSANLAQAFTPLIPVLKGALAGATDLTQSWLSGFQMFATNLITQVPNLMSAIAVRDAQGIGEVLDNIFGNTGRYVDMFRSLAAGAIPIVQQVWQVFQNLWHIASDLGPALGLILGGGLRLAWDALNLLLPALVSVTGWLADNKPVVIGLAAAWAALTLATKAHEATLAVSAAGGMVAWIKQANIIQGVTKVWAAVQWVLNSALLANPITWVVVGLVALGVALYEAWTHSETFRAIVIGALQAVAAAGLWMWDNVLKPTWDALVAAWNAISTAVQWAWTNVIQPVWNAIATAATVLFAVVSTVLITPFLIAWNLLSIGIDAAWNGIIKPAWDALAALAGWLWENVLQPIWGFMQAAWTALVTVIVWYWDNVLHPAWLAIEVYANFLWSVLQGIWAGMQAAWTVLVTAILWAWDNILHPAWVGIEVAAHWLWENVLAPIWGAMQAAWDALLTAFKWAWDNILHPTWVAIETAISWLWNNVLSPIFGFIGGAWDTLMHGIKSVYDNVLHPVWQVFKDALASVQGAFEAVKDGIGAAWDKMLDLVSTPINFVIEIIFNRGLFTAWNWVVDHLPGNLPKAPHWDQLPRGNHFAAGGPVPGWSPHDEADNIPAMLTADEFVVRRKIARRTRPFLEALNDGQPEAVQAAGGWYARGPRFAAGGNVQYAIDIANQMRGTPYVWGGANRSGADCSGFMSIMTNALRGEPNPFHRVGTTATFPWPGFTSGYGSPFTIGNTKNAFNSGVGHMAGSLDGHRVESGSGHGPMIDGNALGANAGLFNMHAWLSAFSGAFATASAQIDKPWYEDLWGSITGAFNWFKDHIKAVGEMAGRFGETPFVKVITGMPGQLLDGLWSFAKDKIAALFASGTTGDGNNAAPGGLDAVRSAVQSVFATKGWGGGNQWAATDWIVNKESGWNPRAQNPSSTASGLFQHIDGTWRAMRPASAAGKAHMKDATITEQAYAGMRYIGEGQPRKFHDPLSAQSFWRANGYYGRGGLVSPMILDTGGLWPHGAVGLNMSGADERVFTPQQDDYWRRFVDVSDRVVDLGGGRRSLIERVEINVRGNDTAYEALDELEHRLQVADLGGRYAWTSS